MQIGRQNDKPFQRKSTSYKALITMMSFCLCFIQQSANIWIMDSGATCHVTYQRENFIVFDDRHTEFNAVANGQQVTACGKGKIPIGFIGYWNNWCSIDTNELNIRKTVDAERIWNCVQGRFVSHKVKKR